METPSVGRRALLGTGLALGAGVMLSGCTDDDPASDKAAAEAPFNTKDWDSVRAQFPLDPAYAQFGAFMLAAHPKPVRDAIERHRAELDRDTAAYLEKAVELEEAARDAAAAYIGGKADDVALTDSTTMGMGLLCAGFKMKPGQSVLTTEHDFYGTRDAVRKLSERTGAPVRRATLYDDPSKADADQIVSRLKAQLQPRTRLVVVTWVHSSTGVRLPVKAIADMLATANRDRAAEDRALLFVDGVHGFGAVDVNVGTLGCDFFTSGIHKWLFGPRGTGVLWGTAWDSVAPVFASFSQPEGPGRLATPGGYHSFEHRWAVPEAFAFHRDVGRDRIATRITEQATRLKDGLAGLKSVRLVTPKDPDLSAGLVMCQPVNVSPNQAVQRLHDEHKIVASVTPYNNPFLRFGTSVLTTPEQVDQVVKAVATL
jgi:selenocysteine lyase/cysteine desulfurase